MLRMAKSSYLSPSDSLECYRLRLANRRRRQTQIRQLILKHLIGDAGVLSDCVQHSDSFEETLYQCALSKTLKDRLKYKPVGIGSFDEGAMKKSLILWVQISGYLAMSLVSIATEMFWL